MGLQQFEDSKPLQGLGSTSRALLRWDCAPSLLVLLAVAGFWIGGSLEWFEMLKDSNNAVGSVVWLYLMLAAVAGSIVLGGGAIFDLARRFSRRSDPDQ
ncbi:hypothetical protein GC088_08775 [Arthrobacter sp. JZ12]|uniref:hypothetical protein n=1 Tax=Arthrobacter sp. JZ12 TaxID=2654190 RepID=UPI002B4903DF|nr:hypothetical protein [Arthrobacter sp. JZ12]WRH25145.1 hypothetical protein GC088_08775 [Arthrobacter sp. JZ12]